MDDWDCCRLFPTRPSRRALVGLLVSFTGVITIVYLDAAKHGVGDVKGDIEATVAELSEAVYLNLGKTLRQEAPPSALMPPILGVGFVLVVAYQAATGGRLMTPVGLGEVGATLGLGILPTALGHTFYFSSLAGLKSFETTTLALIEPIGAGSLAVVVFNGIPGGLFVLGAAFVLLGVVLVLKE